VQEDRVQRGAVDVVLPLVKRAVADANGAGADIARELVAGGFGEVETTVDPVHDLQ